MQEALAREHMRERERQAQHQRLVSEMAAANRWHYLERHARAAYQHHSRRAHRVAQVSAVAE